MALANSGLLGQVGLEEDPNLFVGGATALAPSNKVRMQSGEYLSPSEMTYAGGDLAAANAAQAAMPPPPTPIRRDFDANAYLQGMAGGSQQMKRETGIMGALGYALKLRNPSFDAAGYINNYKQKKYAQMKQQYEAMSILDQQQVERQAVRRMLDADPKNVKEFNTWFKGLGVPNLGLLNNTFDMWRKMNPAVKPEVGYRADGRLNAKGIYDQHKDFRQQTKPLLNGAFEWRRKIALVMAGLREGTGLGDISAINSFQKMIDEGVVRGEDVTMIGSAASAMEQMELTMNNFRRGEKLAEGTRAQMAKIAKDFYDAGTAQVDQRLKGWRDVVQANDQLDWNKVVPQKSWAVLQDPDIAKIPKRLQKLMKGSVSRPLAFGEGDDQHPFETVEAINNIPATQDKWEGMHVTLPSGEVRLIQRIVVDDDED